MDITKKLIELEQRIAKLEEQGVLCSKELLAALQREWDRNLEIGNRLRLFGTPSHNCNCLDYRLGVMDGILIAKSELEKMKAANDPTPTSELQESREKLAANIAEIKATWSAARDAHGQMEAFRILERMVDRLGYGRTENNPSLVTPNESSQTTT